MLLRQSFFIASIVSILPQVAVAQHDLAPCKPPVIDFDEPAHGEGRVVYLTFDDGPDGKGGMTEQVLDVLSAQHIPATFFVCGNVWTDVRHDQVAQATLQRIVREGHNMGTHTMHHRHLPALSPKDAEQEIVGVEALLRDGILPPDYPPITLFRAPFGQPFESDPVNSAWLAPIVARHAVHVGWNINSYDWACKTADCVVDNVMRAINSGHEGTILMHSNYIATVETLPRIIELLRARGFRFETVEQALGHKYGATSQQLCEHYRSTCTTQLPKTEH